MPRRKPWMRGGERRRSDTNPAETKKAGGQHKPKPTDAWFAPEPLEGERVLQGNTQKQGHFRIADNVNIADT